MFRIINKQRNKKGFTLVELVVVIAILGILAAIGVPRLLGFQDRAREQADKQMAVQVKNSLSLLIANGELESADSNFRVGAAVDADGDPVGGVVVTDYTGSELGVTATVLEGLLDELVSDFRLQNTNDKLILVSVDVEGAVSTDLGKTTDAYPVLP